MSANSGRSATNRRYQNHPKSFVALSRDQMNRMNATDTPIDVTGANVPAKGVSPGPPNQPNRIETSTSATATARNIDRFQGSIAKCSKNDFGPRMALITSSI